MGKPAALLLLLPLAGCGFFDRLEGVTPHAGDSQAQAIAAQAVNPWPRAAYDKTWTSDGARAVVRRPPAASAASAE